MSEAKAWAIFSRYIKLRDTNQYGHGRCIDTNKSIFYKRENGRWVSNTDAGHYITREIKTIMFNEMNVHAQLSTANRSMVFQDYRKNLISKIGLENVEILEAKKHEFGNKDYVEIDYGAIFDEYSTKVELLLKNKMF